MMKNLKRGLALLLVMLLSLTVFVACNNDENGNGGAVLDYAGVLAPDTVMIEVSGGTPVLWDEVYYDLQMMRHQLEMFGPIEDWDAPFEGDPSVADTTYREFIIQHAIDTALDRRAIESMFAALGETVEDSVFEEALEQYLAMFDVDEYGFGEILEENFLTLALLRELTEVTHMQTRIAEAFAGGENLDPEEVAAFAEEEDILRAKHILLMTSGDEAEDEAVFAEAMALYEELQGLSGDELFARFDEMIVAYGEDPGMVSSPDGYTFMPGVMVEEFFDTTLATGINEVSAPVRSSFGYHIILRLPIDPSAEVMAGGGFAMTFGEMFSMERFEQAMEEARAGLDYTVMQSLEQLDLYVVFAPAEHEEELEEAEEDLEEESEE